MADVANEGEGLRDLSGDPGQIAQPIPDRAVIRPAGQHPTVRTPPLPTRRKVFDLWGEAQVNPDGMSRQDELLRSMPGELVSLVSASGDDEAPLIQIVSMRGVVIGALQPPDAEALAPALQLGRPHRAKLHCLRGGIPGYPLYGARISIAWDGRPDHPHIALDAEQERERRRRQRSGTDHRTAMRPRVPRTFASRAGNLSRRRRWLVRAGLIGLLALLALLAVASG